MDYHYLLDKIQLGDLNIVYQENSASHCAEISRDAHMGVESLPGDNLEGQTLNTHI